MPNWTRVALLADCPPGSCREVLVQDRLIALFNVDGTLHALDGICPHQGGPLGKGTLEGGTVTCPWHGWQFDVTTGKHRLSPAISQARFEVRVEGGEVFADLGN